MAKTDYKKDIQKLVKMITKLGKKVADDGTFVKRPGKHIFIKFDVGKKPFRKSYSSSPSTWSSVKKAYADTRRQLLSLGIVDSRFSVRFITTIDDVDETIGEMFSLLDTIPTTIRDDISQSVRLYLKEVDKLHPNRTKPYKKKISYVTKTGKKVSYYRYYVFGRKLTPYGAGLTDGFVSAREGTYLEALHFWNKIRRSN